MRNFCTRLPKRFQLWIPLGDLLYPQTLPRWPRPSPFFHHLDPPLSVGLGLGSWVGRCLRRRRMASTPVWNC